MNFTIGTATQGWKNQRVRQAIQVAAAGGVLATTALLAGGVFEDSSPAPSASTFDSSPVTARVETRVSEEMVYFLVDTELEAALLQGADSGEKALLEHGMAFATFEFIVAENPASERAASYLLSAEWATELGANVRVVDLRVSPGQVEPGIPLPLTN